MAKIATNLEEMMKMVRETEIGREWPSKGEREYSFFFW
jgi:hypothetical protein